MSKMARKNFKSDHSSTIHFDSRTNTVMAQSATSHNHVKQKVTAVREVVPGKTFDEIVLVLQYYDYNSEKAIQAYLEDGATEALTQWQCSGSRVQNKKKKSRKGRAEEGADNSSLQNISNNNNDEKIPVINGDHTNDISSQASIPTSSNSDQSYPDKSSSMHTSSNGHQVADAKPQRNKSSKHKHSGHHPQQPAPPPPPKEQHHHGRVRTVSECSTTSLGVDNFTYKKAGLERSVKDLQRQTVSLERLRLTFDSEMDKGPKKIKSVFEEVRKAMAVRYNPIRKGEPNEIHQIFFGFDRPQVSESKPMNPKEQWQWIHYSYGEELGLTSSDEDYVAPPGMDDLIMKDKLSSPEMPPVKELTDSSDLHGTSEMMTMVSNDEDPIHSDEVFSQPSLSLDSPLSLNVASEIPTDFSDTTEDSEGEVACSGHDHLEKLYVDEVFNMNIDKMFTLLFTDTPFYRIFVESRKTFDLDIPSWGEEVDEDGNRVRTIHYTLSLNHSIGPKTSPSSERQTCYKQSKPGIIYVVDCQCENNGIPYADSFFVVTQYCLTRVTKEKCRLRVTGEVKYRKSVMGIVKGMIDRSAVGGLTDYFRDLAVHLRREVEENEKLLGHTIVKKKLRKRRKPAATVSEPLSISRQADRQISSPPSPLRHPKEATSVFVTADSLVRMICVILLFLVLCNTVLYYKLWSLENYTSTIYTPPTAQILDNLGKYPDSQEEWYKLLKQQQVLHDSEIDKWREVLSASIVLVDQMKGTLVHLHDSLEGRLKSSTTDTKPNS